MQSFILLLPFILLLGVPWTLGSEESSTPAFPIKTNYTQDVSLPKDGKISPVDRELVPNLAKLEALVGKRRIKCSNEPKERASFPCLRLGWSSWLLDQLRANETKLGWFADLVSTPETALTPADLTPDSDLERVMLKGLKAWGDASDKLLYYRLKEFSKTRTLRLRAAGAEIAVIPRTRSTGSSGRTLFDPGFNLKMKLPFFRDELKFAVSTGPSFIAGLGLGLVILGIKAIFGPMILAIKYMILSIFIKDLSPFDIFKIFGFGGGHGWAPPPPPPPPHLGWDEPIGGYDSSHDGTQFSHAPGGDKGVYAFYPYDGKPKSGNDLTYGGGDAGAEESAAIGEKRFPSEDFDPFYTPLLSRIDSIFSHLGFASDEGCKERAVCSIYKFPVKYAPYSNLLSAQLSKHQSELKRPTSTSPRVLRYFKYMKAAKDGQGGLNCIELYPNCASDTEKLTNLPMVKTFQQLTELMGTGSGTAPQG